MLVSSNKFVNQLILLSAQKSREKIKVYSVPSQKGDSIIDVVAMSVEVKAARGAASPYIHQEENLK